MDSIFTGLFFTETGRPDKNTLGGKIYNAFSSIYPSKKAIIQGQLGENNILNAANANIKQDNSKALTSDLFEFELGDLDAYLTPKEKYLLLVLAVVATTGTAYAVYCFMAKTNSALALFNADDYLYETDLDAVKVEAEDALREIYYGLSTKFAGDIFKKILQKVSDNHKYELGKHMEKRIKYWFPYDLLNFYKFCLHGTLYELGIDLSKPPPRPGNYC